jgi:predicted Zn-dependent protease
VQANHDELIQHAIALIRAGDRVTARDILREVVTHQPDDVRLWALLAQVTLTREETLAALRHVLRLKPGDEWALMRLRQLRIPAAQPTIQTRSHSRKRHSRLEVVVFYGGILVGVVLLCVAIYLTAHLLMVYGPTF